MITATTVAGGALALAGGAVFVFGDSHRSQVRKKRPSAAEVQNATPLGYATCTFDGARFAWRRRKLYLALIGDVLVFRENENPMADLTETMHLQSMKASLVGAASVDIATSCQKVSLKMDSKQAADNLLEKLQEAADFSTSAARKMDSVREALAVKDNSAIFRINEDCLGAEARRYFFEHRLAERLSRVIEALVEERPRDPASFIAERLRRNQVPRSPIVSYRETRGEEPEVDSPKIALMRLALHSTGNSPAWLNQAQTTSMAVSTPSRNADEKARSLGLSNEWKAAG